MAARGVSRREYEERDSGSRAPGLILAAVAIFGLAILLMYIAVAAPQQGTAMGAIRDVLRGMGGSLAVALPLMLGWTGVLCILAARGREISPWRVAADVVLWVCLFTAVHVFFAERIVRERMTISGFSNFVAKSYSYGKGGGALGALLGWPLYRYLGVAGGFIGALLIALLMLTATGRMARLADWIGDRADDARARREERDEKRERTFDEIEPNPAARAARRAPSRDPYSESIMGSDGSALESARRKATRRSANQEPFAGATPTPGRFSDPDDSYGGRPARAANQPAARKRRPDADAMESAPSAQRRRPDGDAMESGASRRRPAPQRDAATDAPQRARRAAAPVEEVAPARAKGRKKKLYNEEVPSERRRKAAPPEEEIKPLDFEYDEPDDVLTPAEPISPMDSGEAAEPKRPARKPRRDSFKPDRPASFDVEESKAEAPQPTSAETQARLDELKIKPQEYEKPDEDEAPFDTPAEPGAKKKTFPKMKRVTIAEPEEEETPVYNYPPIDLLAQGEAHDTSANGQRDMEKAQLLEDTLHSFGISAKLTGIAHGPAVTRFELQPAPGVKVSRITSLADDIALNLAAMSVRIEAPIPGKAAVGVEIPNDKVEMVRLRDVLESAEAQRHPSRIAVGLGKDNSGRYIVADIAKMPHVLIAGQTGSGKSVCINAIIASILFRATPEEVKLILIDPKVVELSIYNNIPHLVCPVVTDPKKAASALDWAVSEMTGRYKKFAERGVRDIKGYNKTLQEGEKMMPQMVIIIDELADLMMVSPGEVEDSICRLAQLARACGMHLVIATQRPSVNVITGIIKANIPTRIAFSVASQVDSRTMIDHGGAEKLLGNGDMLFVPNGMKSMRVQGAWVSDEEVHAIVEYIKQSGEAIYDPDMLEHLENATRTDAEKEEFNEEYDPRLPEAVEIVLDLGQASISMLQRRMRVGYARAGRLIDEMARRGIVSEADGAKPREVLITREEAEALFEDEE